MSKEVECKEINQILIRRPKTRISLDCSCRMLPWKHTCPHVLILDTKELKHYQEDLNVQVLFEVLDSLDGEVPPE